jgi:hypothetical protein
VDAIGGEFIIPGGWISAVLVVGLVAAACVTVMVFIGWMLMVTAVAMIAGMALLKAAELAVLRIIEWVKKKRAEKRMAAEANKAEHDQDRAGDRLKGGEEEGSVLGDLDDDDLE